jgi:hypothetical protein
VISRIVLTVFSALFAFAPGAEAFAPRVVQSVSANLDGDAHVERVQVLDSVRPNPYGGTAPLHVEFVRVLDVSDGRPFEQRISPTADYFRVSVVPTGVEDSTGLSYRRVIWYSGSTGNGGAAPVFFGLVGWTGGGAKVLWRYEPRLSTLGGRYDGAGARLFEDATRGGPGPEIRLEEGIHHAGDPECCPRTTQVSLFRFAPQAGRYILYSRSIRPS